MKIICLKFIAAIFSCSLILRTSSVVAQELHNRWDELTASEWPKALQQSDSTCILPIGILEKHGPHVPIGSDLIQVREWAARATKQQYAVVFPDYFYGQINEARHQFGTFSLPERIVWDMMEATCDEIARNGFKKILIINGHGGNPQLIRYFIQTRLEKQRYYAVYFFEPGSDSAYKKQYEALHKSNEAVISMLVKEKHPPYYSCVRTSLKWTAHQMSLVSIKTGSAFRMYIQRYGGMPITQIIMQAMAAKQPWN